MNIFVFSTAFAPNVGGIERVVAMLCREFTALGHAVRLATATPRGDHDDTALSYTVLRRPGPAEMRRALRWCDVHVQANVSLKHAWPRVVAPDRFVYQHHNVYQRDDGSLSPLDRAKRALARGTPGIANSRYTSATLGCAHTVLNPYDDATFQARTPWDERSRELVFLGRLVSQKGCDVLLRALARLKADGRAPTLTVIGDGPDRPALEAFATTAGLGEQVRFAGRLEGDALARELDRHRIFVAPSTYEEPFGIVALEALACGCVPVVSARGGLVDAIGEYGFTFPNGDDAALAELLGDLIESPETARMRTANAKAHLAEHRASAVAQRYINVFEHVRATR